MARLYSLIFLALAANCGSTKVGMLVSPSFTSDAISKVSFNFEIFTLQNWRNGEITKWVQDFQIELVYDCSYSELGSNELHKLSASNAIVHVISWSEALAQKFQAIYPHPSRQEQLEATFKALHSLGIAEIMLLSSDFKAHDEYGQEFTVSSSVVIPADTPQLSIDKIVLRNFKSEGLRTVVLDLDGNLADKALQSLDKARMMNEGYAFICSPRAVWLSYAKTGTLIVSEVRTEAARSEFDYELINLDAALSKFNQNSSKLENFLIEAFAKPQFKLLNVVNGSKIVVGEILDVSASLIAPIRFPGDVTNFDPSTAVEIKVTTLSSSVNPGGFDEGNSDVFKGFFVCRDEISSTGFLGRFTLTSRQIECGGSGYSPEYTLACLVREQNALGIAIIGSYSSGHTKGLLEGMKVLNLTHPVIGSYTTATFLSSKATWPNFMRTIKVTPSLVPGYVQFLKKYGYTQVNLFYSDELFGQDFAKAMQEILAIYGIAVVNPANERPLTDAFLKDPSKFKSTGESVVKSGIRPLILLTLPNYVIAILDLLYEVGLRAEDLLCIHNGIYSIIWTEGEKEQIENRMSITVNALDFEQAAFAGPLGEISRITISNAIGADANSGQCNYYDSGYLLAYALKTMILKGKDYEIHSALDAQLRDTSFYGCTGKVAIDKDSNDRRDQDIDVFQFRGNNGSFKGELVMKISLTSTQIFTFIEPLIWQGGFTDAPPMNLLNYADCPFAEEYRHPFEKGKDLVLYLAIGYICAACIILGALLAKLNKTEELKPMTEKVEVSFQDKLVLAIVVIDALQYIGHGPVLNSGKDIYEPMVDYVSGGTIKAINFSKGVYWTLLNSILSVIMFWFFSCILVRLRFKGIYIRILKPLTDLAEKLLPLLGNMMFLPIISILFDVFVCEEGHGRVESELTYQDSFMYRDCNEDCWEGLHLKYSVVTAVALIVYFPVTVATRPVWQLLAPDIHIITRPTFYLQKSLVEVILVSLRRGLRSRERLSHALVYFVVILIHLALSICRKPFNYARLNWWFYLTLLFIQWFCFVCVLDIYFQGMATSTIFIMIIVFGLFLLGKVYSVFGMLAQTFFFPSLLTSPKLMNLQDLFRFAFDLRDVKPPATLCRSSTIGEGRTLGLS